MKFQSRTDLEPQDSNRITIRGYNLLVYKDVTKILLQRYIEYLIIKIRIKRILTTSLFHIFDSSRYKTITNMHPEDLKILRICVDCLQRFIFHSDWVDHQLQTGHYSMKKYDLLSGEMIISLDNRIRETV
jgi:hypothetical protein